MIKKFLNSLVVSVFLTTCGVVSVFATTDEVEVGQSSKSRAIRVVKNAASHLPSGHMVIAAGVEALSQDCPKAIVSALSDAGKSVESLGYYGELATGYSAPIVKFGVSSAVFFGGHSVNRLLGNDEPMSWKKSAINMVRSAVSVGMMHYAFPAIEHFGEEAVKTYVSTTLSTFANSMGVPLTSEMVEAYAPYAIKGSLVAGTYLMTRATSWFSHRFLKESPKTKKD